MAFTAFSRLMRPRTFLYLMTLRTGTEVISLTLIINKVTGVYGILALFTGYTLSPLQLTLYIYSIAALAITVILLPHIRKQSPFQCLCLAWFFAIDSLINALYTMAFALAWFLVLARHTAPLGDTGRYALGADMIDDTAGFTNPKYNVSRVDIVDGAAAIGVVGLVGHGQDAAAAASEGAGGNVLNSTILQSGSIVSVSIICALWAIRMYFILVMMAYARGVLRQSVALSSAAIDVPPRTTTFDDNSEKAAYLENPFTAANGWTGRLGRAMVAWPRSYWLGPDADGENRQVYWEREVGGRVNEQKEREKGVEERERRRRAGTGPPILKPIELGNLKK